MTNSPPAGKTYRESLHSIEDSIPMKMPWHRPAAHLWPRIERAEAKVAFFADYLEYLEARIAALESTKS